MVEELGRIDNCLLRVDRFSMIPAKGKIGRSENVSAVIELFELIGVEFFCAKFAAALSFHFEER